MQKMQMQMGNDELKKVKVALSDMRHDVYKGGLLISLGFLYSQTLPVTEIPFAHTLLLPLIQSCFESTKAAAL